MIGRIVLLLISLAAFPARAWALPNSQQASSPSPGDIKANIALCNAGDPKACNFVGAMYATGTLGVVNMDQNQAFTFFQKACDGGYVTACANLANQYFNGWGVAMDRSRAVQLYKQSCDRSVVTACMDLGVIYRDGKGVERKDSAYAVQLFQRACDLSAAACASIASMYELGIGVGKDVARAVTLYQRSCNATPSDSAEDVQKIWSRASCNVLTRLK